MTQIEFKVVNHTPHTVTLFHCDGQPWAIAPSTPIRVDEVRLPIRHPAGLQMQIAMDAVSYGDVALPPEIPGTIYVVSMLVLQVVRDKGIFRPDLFMPGTLVRDGKGNIIGCNGLSQLA